MIYFGLRIPSTHYLMDAKNVKTVDINVNQDYHGLIEYTKRVYIDSTTFGDQPHVYSIVTSVAVVVQRSRSTS